MSPVQQSYSSQAPILASDASTSSSSALNTTTSGSAKTQSTSTTASQKSAPRPPPLILTAFPGQVALGDIPRPDIARPATPTSGNGSQTSALSSQLPTPPESPCARSRRGPPRTRLPPIHSRDADGMQILEIALPQPGGRPLCVEMVTVTARKGDRVHIVADAWHLEQDCHFEWEFAFEPRTIDMSTLRARVESDGKLVIRVRKMRVYG